MSTVFFTYEAKQTEVPFRNHWSAPTVCDTN